MKKEGVSDMSMIIAGSRIGMAGKTMLGSGRQEANALRKAWRRFLVWHRVEELARMRFFDLVPLCGTDAIERQATRVLSRRTANCSVPTGIMPRHSDGQVALRHARY